MDYLQCMCTCTQMKCGRDARISLYYVWNSVRACVCVCVCVWFCVCDSHTPHSHTQSQTCTVECVSVCVCGRVLCVQSVRAPVLLCANINALQVQGCGPTCPAAVMPSGVPSSPAETSLIQLPRGQQKAATPTERELVAQCICNLCLANSNRSTVVI